MHWMSSGWGYEMTEVTAMRFVRELRSYYAISIINLAFGAVQSTWQ